ncbi:MAG: hypothetical protein ABIJ16_08195 [Bacteroidota bacterium]
MKKTLLFITLASLAIMVTFSGCKKEEDDYVPEPLPTATITGKVWAELDWTNAVTEYAPSGTKIIAVYNAGDLVDNPVAGYTYKNITVEATVGSDGTYTLTIPATGNGVGVQITGVDFEYNTVTTATTTQRTVYSLGTTNTTVIAGMKQIIDLSY